MNNKLWITVIFFASLFWLWPNFIHEPMHLAALRIQGSDGVINYDLASFPATPSTTRSEPVAGIAGGLLFALAPSILSVILLIMIWLTRERAALLTHVSLPMYLVSDLFINVYRHTHNTSDYYFLTVLNPLIGYAILAIVVLGGGTVIMSTLTPAAKNKGLMPELKAKALFTTPQ